jgi:hypothetical protein
MVGLCKKVNSLITVPLRLFTSFNEEPRNTYPREKMSLFLEYFACVSISGALYIQRRRQDVETGGFQGQRRKRNRISFERDIFWNLMSRCIEPSVCIVCDITGEGFFRGPFGH